MFLLMTFIHSLRYRDCKRKLNFNSGRYMENKWSCRWIFFQWILGTWYEQSCILLG